MTDTLTTTALAIARDRGRRVAARVELKLTRLHDLGDLEFAMACDQARLNLAREAGVCALDLAHLTTVALKSSARYHAALA